jgi:hypothetical protein
MIRKSIFSMGTLFCALASSLWAQQAVLYTGSDWCDAGVPLQKIWEQADFRESLGIPVAIVDEPEVVTDAVRAEWKTLDALRWELEAYPGVAVFDAEGRCVLLREGLAWDTTAEQLKALVDEGLRRAETVANYLAQEGVEGADAAIQLLLPELGLKRTQQAKGLKAAWDLLAQRDPKDESGIRAALTFEPMETIYRVHDFAGKKDYEGGEAYIVGLLSDAAKARLSKNQLQGLMLHTFVLHRHNESRKAENVALLREVVALDPTTHFGQGAYGMLKLLGEKVDEVNYRPAPIALKPRKTLDAPATWQMPVSTSPVYVYARAVLSQTTLQAILQQEGGADFLEAFFADEVWAEDFFGSGPAKPSWDECLKMLDAIAWQVPLTSREMKKWATAAALNASESNHEAMLRMVVAFADIRARKLLVRGVEDLPVGLLRYVLTPAQVTAEDMLWMAKMHNVPPRSYSGVCWYAPYRTFNFFGDSIHGADYYKPWDHVYNRREAARKVGGVCGSLSYYGSCGAKAHGLPSTPGGQPAHCAYSLYIPAEMRWWICYNVNPYTGAHYQMWHYSFDYLPMAADTYWAEGRIDALRAFWTAEAARMKAEPQPVRSPMTCKSYVNWKGVALPREGAKLPIARFDEGLTIFNLDQAGEGHRDNVVLVWEGKFTFKKAANARITLMSDDGSDLTLSGKKIIDNDGRHGLVKKIVEAKVSKGVHPFKLRYFNYNGGRGFEFDVRACYPYSAKRDALYAQAVKYAPQSYDILDAWEQWLAQAEKVPVEAWEAFANAAAKGLTAHPRPAWDLIGRNALGAIEKARGKDVFAQTLARLHGVIRQDNRPVDEFCDLSAILDRHAEMLTTDEQRLTLFAGALAGQVGTKDAFAIVMRWGGNRFLKDSKLAQRYVEMVGEVLMKQGSGNDMGKFLDGAICEASRAGNITAFHGLTDLRDAMMKSAERKTLDLSFTASPLLSDKGLLRLSTTSQWDQPGIYRAIIDGKSAAGNFHTASENTPWAEVELPGMAMVDAVYIENIHTQNNGRAVPFKLELSEDGKAWQQVAIAEQSKEDWKFTFAPIKARFVRVTWTGGETGNKTFLHFRKFTVHGKKLY